MNNNAPITFRDVHGRTITVAHDPLRDTLTVEGTVFSGDLLRLWTDPPADTLYRFRRNDGGPLTVEKVTP